MRRRNLIKGALVAGVAASTTGRLAMAALAPANEALTAGTLDGGEVFLSRTAVTGLQNSLTGDLLKPDHPAYDSSRQLWNAMFDKHPALIAHCASTEDVARTVEFGRANNLLTSVRCGGHSFSGKSAADGGLMIDLSFMHQVDVDTAAKIAHVGGGARLGHVDLATLKHNLVTVVGTDSDTGAGGLTLGGGMGRLNRMWGLTIDNLLSAELVTADGQVRQASADVNPDLFWAIRGGGGNFGVVTRFDYKLHEFNPTVFGGDLLWSWDQTAAVLTQVDELAQVATDELFLSPYIFTRTDGQPAFGVEVIFVGDHSAGEQAVRPLRGFGKLSHDGLGAIQYMDRQLTADTETRSSHYIKTGFVERLDSMVISAIVDDFPRVPGLGLFFHQMGGAVGRVGPLDTAFSHRDANFAIGIGAGWKDPGQFDMYRQTVRGLYKRLEPHTVGFYNNLMVTSSESKLTDNYAVNLARLRRIKGRYDPDNFFRLNANIKPEPATAGEG